MNRYFGALVGGFLIALNLAAGPLLHRWRTRWNATRDEIKDRLPGDEIVGDDAHEAGITPRPGEVENAALQLNAAERIELGRLLDEDMKRNGA